MPGQFDIAHPFDPWHTFGGGGLAVPPTFAELVAALPGIFAWYPQDEASGLACDNALGVAALDGAYDSASKLADVAFPDPPGGAAPDYSAFPDTRQMTIPAAQVAARWNGDAGWIATWLKPTVASMSDSATHPTCIFDVDGGSNRVYTQIYNNLLAGLYIGGGTNQNLNYSFYSQRWAFLVMSWNTATSLIRLYVDGVQVNQIALTSAMVGAIASSVLARGAGQWLGGLAHSLIGAGSIPTESQFNAIYESVVPGTRSFVAVGDSKSNENDIWPSLLVRALEVDTGDIWRERPGRLAVAGYRAADLNAWLAANLPSKSGNPEHVLLNVGANDQSGGTSEAVYKAQLTAIIDQLLAKFTSANIYVAHSFRNDVATPTSPADMKIWTNAVIATYASRVYVGHDETVWFAGNIATYSDDGAHYNAAGAVELVNQWMAILP